MKRTEIQVPSTDGRTTLHGYRWEPEGEIIGVVQLVHGMEEYIFRYDGLAEYLTGQGFAVIGHDHLGHGGSIVSEEDLGFFAEKNGYECILTDMHRMTLLAKKTWPDKPVFMIAHSMGSFFARRYITLYPNELTGLVLSGTGFQPYLLVHVGKRMARLVGTVKGHKYRSPLLQKLALGSYGTLEEWLCTRPEIVEAYKADPLCGQPFTAWAFKDFFKLLEVLALDKGKDNIPKDFPILLVAGMKDPVGDCSKGVLKVYNRYRKLGLKDVDCIFYKDDMHEIFNEYDREDVYADLRRFLTAHMK